MAAMYESSHIPDLFGDLDHIDPTLTLRVAKYNCNQEMAAFAQRHTIICRCLILCIKNSRGHEGSIARCGRAGLEGSL